MNLRTKNVIVVGNGSFNQQLQIKSIYDNNRFIIAVNGGTKHIIKQNIIPDLIIGDLDSLSLSIKRKILQNSVPVIKHPEDKDFTDLELAVNYLLQCKPKDITLIGVLGKRLDQTFANLCLLESFLINNIKCQIIDNATTIWLINKSITINVSIGDLVSIHPLTNKVQGITTDGLKFPLSGDVLLRNASRGISNVALRSSVNISVNEGTAYIFHIKKKKTHSPVT